MLRNSSLLVAIITLALFPSDTRGQGKVKVFVLAGQSNMEGKGFPEPVSWQVTQPKYRDRYKRFVKDGDFDSFTEKLTASQKVDPRRPAYDWSVRSDVWVNFLSQHGNLKVGYGVPSKCFGPEYCFGHVVGDHVDDQVLIIKTAWGGKSLGQDFLPPSSGLPSEAWFQEKVRKDNENIQKSNERNRVRHQEQNRPFKPRPLTNVAQVKARYGHFYRLMLKEVRETLANLKERFPGYQGQGYEMAGFVWFQGWNDQFNEDWSTHYGAHMANFIRDVRKDLNAPKMPFVIGQVGFDGTREEKKSRDGGDSARTKIKKGQLAMASIPAFRGNVAVVKTDRFWDQDADAIYRGPGSWKKDVNKWHQFGNDRPYHYLGSPWFFAQTGTAFGEAMVGLLK